MKLNTLQKVLLVLIVGSVLAFFSYYLLVHDFPSTSVFSDKDVVKNWVVGVLLFIIVSFILLIIFKGFAGATREKRLLESPRKFVNVNRAAKIFVEEFIKANNVPHTLNYDVVGDYPEVIPKRGVFVDVRHTRHFKDPKMQTSESFFLFEIECNAGSKRGIHTALIRLDEGEDYIRNNWFENFEDNCPIELFKLRRDEYPITSAKSFLDRLNMKQIELMNDGDFTKDDLMAFEAVKNNSLADARRSNPVPYVEEKTKSDDAFLTRITDKESELVEELSEIEEDMKKYRERGKK